MTLHPQAQAFVANLVQQAPPGWEEMSPAEARQRFNGFAPLFGDAPQLARVEDHRTDGGIPVRLYSPSSQPRPVVLYFHGGGWVLGNIGTHDALCRRLADASGCTVISVEYGCSPENPFPGPVNDCFDATQFVSSNSARLNVDASRLAVAGDSAGGQLAAAVCLKSIREDGPNISLQVLLYPITDRDFQTDSYLQFAKGFGLTRANMQWFWQQFCSDERLPELAAPLRAVSLAGLPPTHLVTAGYDVLRDEGVAYAKRLQSEGVTVSQKQYDDMLHGFLHFAGIFDTGVTATVEIGAVIRDALKPEASF